MAQNRESVAMMGVNINKTIVYTFVLGSALAAVAGYFNGMYYQTVKFDIGLPLAIKGFSAAVVGGLGNVYGSIFGALLIGYAEMFGSAFIPGGSQNKDIITFLLIIGFLVFRPSGIIGEKTYEKV
ncbi:MAG: branched-chain amino acid ABC transporter permease [Firmicutes bacterium]|nr:branched-chain amino acid ABC transporter permease [Bacillota bacterium]